MPNKLINYSCCFIKSKIWYIFFCLINHKIKIMIFFYGSWGSGSELGRVCTMAGWKLFALILYDVITSSIIRLKSWYFLRLIGWFQKPIENEGLNPQTHFESLRWSFICFRKDNTLSNFSLQIKQVNFKFLIFFWFLINHISSVLSQLPYQVGQMSSSLPQ